MITLGICNNDLAGACVVVNGEIMAAVSEERFTRVKDHKVWPSNSIEFVLSHINANISDVDQIAYGWNAGFSADKHLLLYIDRFIEEKNPEVILHMKRRVSNEINNDKEKRNEFDNFIRLHSAEGKAVYIDHHKSHSYAAYLCSPFSQDAIAVSCDGRGDFQSFTVMYFNGKDEKILQQETSIDSIGYFAGRITYLLGFKPNRHEGKVVGLAAHGNPDIAMPLIKKMIDIENGRIRGFLGDFYQPNYHQYSDILLNEIKKYKKEDIAAAAQKHLENIICEIIEYHVRNTGCGNICLGGGVFANVKINQKISEIDGVNAVYILPPMGDGGLALQAAVIADYLKTGKRHQVPTMKLGVPTISTNKIDLFSRYKNLELFDIDNSVIVDLLIEALTNNLVIGTYRGRSEYGPRALCNRSILYRTDDATMNTWLNERLNRTEFMPFAPITIKELAEKSYIGWKPDHMAAKFMTITYNCTDQFIKNCPAVVHVDGTARPQIIYKEEDLFLHSLLTKWYNVSGQFALVNTSFNKHEEPIIGSLNDACDTIEDGIVDLLLVNDKQIIVKYDSKAYQIVTSIVGI